MSGEKTEKILFCTCCRVRVSLREAKRHASNMTHGRNQARMKSLDAAQGAKLKRKRQEIGLTEGREQPRTTTCRRRV
jgi:hypothetical protein